MTVKNSIGYCPKKALHLQWTLVNIISRTIWNGIFIGQGICLGKITGKQQLDA